MSTKHTPDKWSYDSIHSDRHDLFVNDNAIARIDCSEAAIARIISALNQQTSSATLVTELTEALKEAKELLYKALRQTHIDNGWSEQDAHDMASNHVTMDRIISALSKANPH